jgi:hypothetical protein
MWSNNYWAGAGADARSGRTYRSSIPRLLYVVDTRHLKNGPGVLSVKNILCTLNGCPIITYMSISGLRQSRSGFNVQPLSTTNCLRETNLRPLPDFADLARSSAFCSQLLLATTRAAASRPTPSLLPHTHSFTPDRKCGQSTAQSVANPVGDTNKFASPFLQPKKSPDVEHERERILLEVVNDGTTSARLII